MERTETHPLRFSRRQFLVGAGWFTAAILATGTAGLAGYETLKKNPKESPIPETEKNLVQALELMDSYDNELVQAAVEFYRSDQKQSFDFINSGSSREPARVVLSIVDQERTVKIALLEDQFTNEQFQAQKTAISLFEAFYVYQKAKQDPRKFSNYPYYKASLEHDAESISSQIFSEK